MIPPIVPPRVPPSVPPVVPPPTPAVVPVTKQPVGANNTMTNPAVAAVALMAFFVFIEFTRESFLAAEVTARTPRCKSDVITIIRHT